jgi:hypothetical protein
VRRCKHCRFSCDTPNIVVAAQLILVAALKKTPPMAGQEGRKEESQATFTTSNLPDMEATKCDLLHSVSII